MEEKKIQREIERQFFVLSEKHNLFGVFLRGCQNYGIDTDEINTVAVVVPTLDDLIFQEPISRKIKTKTGECELIDIRSLFWKLQNQNINYIEILFTDCFQVSEKQKDCFNRMVHMREDIARYDEELNTNCIMWEFNTESRWLFREDDEDVMQHGYRRKSYCNMYRLYSMMENYCSKFRKEYKWCLSAPGCKGLNKRLFPPRMVRENIKNLTSNMETIHKEFEPRQRNTLLDVIFKNLIKEAIVNGNDKILA